MLDAEAPPAQPPQIVDVYAVVTKDFEDFRYAKEVENFQLLREGEAFAIQDGRLLTVAEESYLLIPMRPESTKIREEVCYLGRQIAA
jgi:hypothetical protein